VFAVRSGLKTRPRLGIPGSTRWPTNRSAGSRIQGDVTRLIRSLLVLPAVLGCTVRPHSSMLLERRGDAGSLGVVGPDALALPVSDRFRYGVVLGSVMTSAGERGCTGDAWLQPRNAPVMDVRPIAPARLMNMFRFPQLLPGPYVLGVRCMGFEPVRRDVEVRVGHVVRAVVTMRPQPLRSLP
jgi:hypothetical protein